MVSKADSTGVSLVACVCFADSTACMHSRWHSPSEIELTCTFISFVVVSTAVQEVAERDLLPLGTYAQLRAWIFIVLYSSMATCHERRTWLLSGWWALP